MEITGKILKSVFSGLLLLNIFFLKGQVGVIVNIPSNKIPIGADFIADIKVHNMPEKGRLAVKVNGTDIEVIGSEAKVVIKDIDCTISENIVILDLAVFKYGSKIYSEKRELIFMRFQPYVCIESQRNGIFYKHIDNTFTVAANGFTLQELAISIYISTRKVEEKYVFTPRSIDSIYPISVFGNLPDGTLMLLDKRTIHLQELPSPDLKLSKNIQEISLSDTVLNLNLSFLTLKDLKCVITEFVIHIKSNNSITKRVISGSQINGDILEIIRNLKSGDSITLSNLQYEIVDGDRKITTCPKVPELVISL